MFIVETFKINRSCCLLLLSFGGAAAVGYGGLAAHRPSYRLSIAAGGLAAIKGG